MLPRNLALLASTSALLLASCASSGSGAYQHGTWKGEGAVRSRQQVGPWTYWYVPGATLRARGSYRNDRQVGEWTYWHDNEVVAWNASYDDRTYKLSGHNVFWWDDASRRTAGFFDSDQKQGFWVFWDEEGNLLARGCFADDRRELHWIHFHPDGSLLADGYVLDGERVGRWRFGEPDGSTSEASYPVPSGVALVRDEWDDGVPRREGFLRDGVPTGAWTTSHSNGRPRITGSFREGKADGLWVAWNPDGTPLAAGSMKEGEPFGNWRLWTEGGKQAEIRVRVIPFAGEWSPDSLSATESSTAVVGTWLGELLASARPAAEWREAAGKELPAPPDELVALVDRPLRVPILYQPFTKDEVARIPEIEEMYTVGLQDRPRGRYDKPKESKGDVELSTPLLGNPLPDTVLYTVDGEELELDDLKGKNVLVVILRGFDGQVCIYCTYQVDALSRSDFQEAFRQRNTEIVIVYPGARDRLLTFQQAFADETNGQEIPFVVTYDPAFELVEALNIRASEALPTTLLLDEAGIVRYAYVGKEIWDRPAVKALISQVDEMN